MPGLRLPNRPTKIVNGAIAACLLAGDRSWPAIALAVFPIEVRLVSHAVRIRHELLEQE